MQGNIPKPNPVLYFRLLDKGTAPALALIEAGYQINTPAGVRAKASYLKANRRAILKTARDAEAALKAISAAKKRLEDAQRQAQVAESRRQAETQAQALRLAQKAGFTSAEEARKAWESRGFGAFDTWLARGAPARAPRPPRCRVCYCDDGSCPHPKTPPPTPQHLDTPQAVTITVTDNPEIVERHMGELTADLWNRSPSPQPILQPRPRPYNPIVDGGRPYEESPTPSPNDGIWTREDGYRTYGEIAEANFRAGEEAQREAVRLTDKIGGRGLSSLTSRRPNASAPSRSDEAASAAGGFNPWEI